ncbi:hypothetical protein L1987_43884 [Smallanthus sonchifolius]|uniref:Uncharacterized protein n=1 Tax=Smallanthus sonchifolius TaxID=185202 RepID=A0ACB9GMB8_9ASTR|nr:hypothetical protein L1987_43884 [Smallanthus sonchifolius]
MPNTLSYNFSNYDGKTRTLMACFRGIFDYLIPITLAVFFCTPTSSVVAEDDAQCLRGVQRSLRDPESQLSSWNFNNTTAGFVCNFPFVSCWNDQENRVLLLALRDLGLVGSFPSDLRFCVSLQKLDLAGLCGKPLGSCGGLNTKNLAIIVAAGVFGAAASLLIGFGLWWWCFMRSKRKRRNGVAGEDDSSSWSDTLRSHKLVQVSLFQKPLVKVRLVDLMIATNNFSKESIIISTRTGTTYKAVLRDGSAIAIKRLSACRLHERLFQAEMNALGNLRHPNLTPLLGYCIVEDEKLLIYKHMLNGTLSSLLAKQSSLLDWPTRFKIGLGAARGLAWLHHGCRPAILHQNISSNAIFVDEDYDARIVDVGLARLMDSSNSHPDESSFANGELGEFGYVAPE